MKLQVTIALFLGLAACTEKNPALCSDESPCSDGLICRGNQCVAETCTTAQECEAGAPYCSGGLCAMTCEIDAECPGFGGDVADAFCIGGTCAECRDASDCTDPTRAICDAHACRGCTADSECASGACGADGACVDAATLLYLDPSGFDGGSCTQPAPCKTLTFALSKATLNRYVVSMTAGQYVEAVNLDSSTTAANRFEIHGHGAAVVAPAAQDSSAFVVTGGFSTLAIRDLSIAHQPNNLLFGSSLVLDNVSIQGAGGVVDASGGMTATNVSITGLDGIRIRAQFTANGFSLTSPTTNMFTALEIRDAVVSATNLVVSGAAYRCINFFGTTSGSISFATIADCGSSLSAIEGGPAAIKCAGSTVALQSSIVWSPGSTFDPIDQCNFSHMIIGPRAVAGASFADPQFKNLGAHDVRLNATSPAIDMIEAGPMTDVAGTSRPQGPRFDLGAYEYNP
ncbi:MAG: choice-of-anchor Q domain-containing protein [Kofleriaceae bacterium]